MRATLNDWQSKVKRIPRICALWLANASPLRFPQPVWFRREFPYIITAPVVGAIRWCTRTLRNIGPPVGCASALESLRDNQLDGRVILEDQGAPWIPQPSAMVECGHTQHRLQPSPIFWSHFPEAHLLSYSLGLIDSHKRLVKESSSWAATCYRKDPAYRYIMNCAPRRLDGPWTSIITEWVPTHRPTNYAHWLFDALPRLGILNEFPADTRIIVPSHLHPFQESSLELLGLCNRWRKTPERFLSIEDYYFSSPTSVTMSYDPYAVEFLRHSFLKFADTAVPTPRRFFLKRTGQMRNLVNETEVLEFFNSIGWAVVDTATMPFTQQIQLFANADAICGIHGAGMANTVWCRPGCQLVEMFSDNFLNGCFEWVAQVVGTHHRYITFKGDYMLNMHVEINRLRTLCQALAL